MSLFDFGQGITLKELLENPDLKCPPKDNNVGKKDKSGGYKIDPSSAFLGPNLWNNPDDDYNLEFMDLDEFLSENGISVGENDSSNTSDSIKETGIKENKSEDTDFVDALLPLVNPAVLTEKINSPKEDILPESETEEEALDSPPLSPQVTYDVDPSDLALASIPGQDFDPKKRKFSVDELKPQPIIKKSRKVFVPEECKDQKYWSRRKKNNVAAKRSREARRIKENQIALRAAYLEKENNALKEEIKKMKLDNMNLTTRLEKYECRSLIRFNKSDIN